MVDDLKLGRMGRPLRQRLGWRQRDLGDQIGLSQGEISLFERGRIDGMPVATVRRILAASTRNSSCSSDGAEEIWIV